MLTPNLSRLGAKSNIQSGRGRTALFEAVLRIKENSSGKDLQESVEIINVLCNLAYPGNEVDVNVPNPKLYNRTALMMAIYHGHAEMAFPLIQHPRISINQQDAGGYTVLSLAALGGMTDIVKEILEFDEILVDTTEYRANQTALMLAAERNHHDIVELLLRRGAKPNLKNSNGKTAILRAVEEGNLEVVSKMTEPQWAVDLFCLVSSLCTSVLSYFTRDKSASHGSAYTLHTPEANLSPRNVPRHAEQSNPGYHSKTSQIVPKLSVHLKKN